MTPKEAEAYTRARWDTPVMLRDTTTRDLGCGLLLGQRGIWPGTEDWPSVWLAAAEATRQREEEIRQKREEIALVKLFLDGREDAVNSPYKSLVKSLFGDDLKHQADILRRVLALLESQLAALLVGMKETP